jgi:hypothetical protein
MMKGRLSFPNLFPVSRFSMLLLEVIYQVRFECSVIGRSGVPVRKSVELH